jgi:hypothetical protein
MNLRAFYILFTSSLQSPLPSMRTFGYNKYQSNFFMKHLKKSFTLLMLLTSIIGSRTFAQDSMQTFSSYKLFNQIQISQRGKEVIQDNEYTSTGFERGNFYDNPLMLDGKPLDYNIFNLGSKGELTVIKGAAITAKTIQVPFYAYLRRDGKKVIIPGERYNPKQMKIDLSEILRFAKPGDQLVIEPNSKEDGPVKRILKLLGGGC